METRKNPRLREWDYGTNAAYFVTVCVQNQQSLLSTVVGRDDPGAPPCVVLSPIGRIIDKYIRSIQDAYQFVSVDKYVIMPNHIHLLLTISADQRRAESSRPTGMEEDRASRKTSRPTVSQIIGAFKRFTNKETGLKLWQSSFHDHIIRNEHDYLTRWQYIDDNPAKWLEDEYYI